MKIRWPIFLLATYFLFLIKHPVPQVLADTNFVKSNRNPLVISNIEDKEILQSHIFLEDAVYRGVFSVKNPNNKYSLYIGSSGDGYKWTLIKEILTASNNLSDPKVFLLSDNGIKLFFTFERSDGIYEILSSDCDKEYNCSSEFTSVLKPENDLSESRGVSYPYIYQENNDYYLLYNSWGPDGFRISMAISSDLVNWERCGKTLINNGGAPFLFKNNKNNQYYLYFHGTTDYGISHITSSDNVLNCSTNWSQPNKILQIDQEYDKHLIISPSVIENKGAAYLYYSGRGDNGWTLNMATSEVLTQEKPTIVLIPGLFGSWNKDAILHERNVELSDWQINPIANEYVGLINTLNNLGYQNGKDLYIFAYDWRKSLENSASDLDNFIKEEIVSVNPDQTFSLVGHSLGGLIGRIYAQKHKPLNLDNIITIGSPHKGVAQVYKAVEAGEIDRYNNLEWLAQKVIIQLYRDGMKTDRQVLNEKMPILRDLLPTYNYILNADKTPITIDSMSIKNNTLLNYNHFFLDSVLLINTVVGEKGNTLSGFRVTSPTFFDKLMGNYIDGRPVENIYEIGDYVVTGKSAKIEPNSKTLSLDHGELVYRSQGIKEILNALGIENKESDISEGDKTNLFPSLIFLVRSPIELEVKFENQIFSENKGVVFVENAHPGNYEMIAKGKEKGRYSVLIGSTNENYDNWYEIEGEITSDDPTGERDRYSFILEQHRSELNFKEQDLLNELINYLDFLFKSIKSKHLQDAIGNLKKVRLDDGEKVWKSDNKDLISAHENIFKAINKESSTINRTLLLKSISKLEKLYGQINERKFNKLLRLKTRADLVIKTRLKALAEKKLIQRNNKKKETSYDLQVLQNIQTRVKEVEVAIQQQSYAYADILLRSVGHLVKLI